MSGTQRENAREGTTEEASPRDTSDLSASASASEFASVDEELEFTAPKPRIWARSRTVRETTAVGASVRW